MTGQRIGYTRVSSVDQNTDRQLDGLELDKVFEDKASGKDTDRPQLKALLGHVREGDEVYVHEMARLARNLEDLLKTVRFMTDRGVKVTFIKENLTFTGDESPMSLLMLSIMGAFAQFERSLIKERQREGIALAKQRGVYKGRAHKLTPEQATSLRERRSAGESVTGLAKEFGISRQTAYEYLRNQGE